MLGKYKGKQKCLITIRLGRHTRKINEPVSDSRMISAKKMKSIG